MLFITNNKSSVCLRIVLYSMLFIDPRLPFSKILGMEFVNPQKSMCNFFQAVLIFFELSTKIPISLFLC